MIIAIISILIFIGSLLGLWYMANKMANPNQVIATVLAILTLVFALPALGGIVGGVAHSVNYDMDHVSALEERDAIVIRMEQQSDGDSSISINGGYYMEAIEFNKKIYHANKWGKNPWTSWYFGWEYADIDPINLKEFR